MRRTTARHAASFAVAFMLLPMPLLPHGARQEVPSEYAPVAGRERLTSIDDPLFVAASEARVRDDAWVIGVVVNGQARAYGLALLNQHEVVNDTINGVELAVAWSPYANTAMVVSRGLDDRTLRFDPAEGLLHGGLILRDRETGSLWPILRGVATIGPLSGTALAVLPVSDRMLWAEWRARHPDTSVLSVDRSDGDGGATALQDPGDNEYREFFASDTGFGDARTTDTRLDDKAGVFAFLRGSVAYAVDTRRVIGGKAFQLHDGAWALVYREAADRMFRGSAAFLSSAGFEQRGGSWFELSTDAEFNAITRDFGGAPAARLPGFDVFWYAWSLTHPDTELLR